MIQLKLIFYFGRYIRLEFNDKYDCVCSSRSGNGTIKGDTDDDVITIYDSEYIISLSIGNSDSDCVLNYDINFGLFLNISAMNWLHIRFVLSNNIDLVDTQFGELAYDFSIFCNVFNVSSDVTIVYIDKTFIYVDESDLHEQFNEEQKRASSRNAGIRRLSQNKGEEVWYYFVNIIIETNTASDAS